MNLLPLLMMMSSLAIESTEMNNEGIKVTLRNTSGRTVQAFRLRQDSSAATSVELINGIKPGASYDLQFYSFSVEPEVTGVVFADGTIEGKEAPALLDRRKRIKADKKWKEEQFRKFMNSGKHEEKVDTLIGNCYPQDRVVSEQLNGCDTPLKNIVTQVSFDNGYSKTVSQTGTGQCARDSTCHWWELPSTVQCWPTFETRKGAGYWEQTVTDSRIVIDYNVSCPGDDGTAVLIPGYQCAPNGDARTEEVRTSCYIGGYPGDFNPFPDAGECSWTFLPGLPYCGDIVNK